MMTQIRLDGPRITCRLIQSGLIVGYIVMIARKCVTSTILVVVVMSFYFIKRKNMTEIELRSDMTVELVHSDARDADVIFAAKVSTMGEQTEMMTHDSIPDPEAFINFLMRNRHGSPFEHNSMTFFIRAPIFVFREFHRHRIGWSYNEESARYSKLRPTFYVPDENRNLIQVGKPGHYNFVPGNPKQQKYTVDRLAVAYKKAYFVYEQLLGEGIAREVARDSLPTAIYSSMYATCNARSMMNFLSLRTKHENASFPSYPLREIEMVAEQMESKWAEIMPVTHAAFTRNGRVAP